MKKKKKSQYILFEHYFFQVEMKLNEHLFNELNPNLALVISYKYNYEL